MNLGMTVIVTDHHEIPFSMVEGQKKYHLPLAQAIVNPQTTGMRLSFQKYLRSDGGLEAGFGLV